MDAPRHFVMWPLIVATVWLGAWTAAVSPAHADESTVTLSLDKRVYVCGETLRIAYTLPGTVPGDGTTFDLEVAGAADVAFSMPFHAGGAPRHGVISIETEQLCGWPGHLLDADPTRAIVEVRLRRLGSSSGARLKFILLRRIEPAPGALSLGGRSSFETGEAIQVVTTLPPSVAARHAKATMELQFVQLGRAVPGGAVELDRVVKQWALGGGEAGLHPMDGRPVTHELPMIGSLLGSGRRPGAYEIRLLVDDVLIDSVRFDIVVSRLAGALRLTPVQETPYEWNRVPTLRVAIPKALQSGPPDPPWIGPGSVLNLRDDLGTTWQQVGRGETRPDASWEDVIKLGTGDTRTPDTLPPGDYEVRLYSPDYTLSLDYHEWSYIADSRRFSVQGNWPEWRIVNADFPYGAIKLAVASGNEVPIGSPIPVTITLPPNAAFSPNKAAMLALYRKAGYTRFCARYEEVPARKAFGGGEAMVVTGSGRFTLEAVSMPGSYEVRLYQGAPGGVGEDGPLAMQGGLLAKMDLEVVVPALPTALRLARGARIRVREAVDVEIDIPADKYPAADTFVLVLARAPDIAVGGGLRPASHELFPQTVSFEITERHARVQIPAIDAPGNYELRLIYRGFAVARVPVQVIDPEAPPFPPGTEPRVPPTSDWPEQDDPVRGLNVWFPRDTKCGGAPRPTLRITTVDAPFETLDSLSTGDLFRIEIVYADDPGSSQIAVTVRLAEGEGKLEEMARREGPRLYRTRAIRLDEAGADRPRP